MNHTFVVCAYGDSPFLEECILSLMNQTLKSEVLIYTSTPSKYIQNIADKYSLKMLTKTGGSIGRDWNNAFSLISSKYVTIAHQDDIYKQNYLEQMDKYLKKSPETIIAFSDYIEMKEGIEIEATLNLKIKKLMLMTLNLFPNSIFWRKRVLAFGNPICCPSVTYNLEQVRGFLFDETMKVSLDWYAWYVLASYRGRFTYIRDKLMIHRIHANSETSNTIADNTRTKEDLMMYELFWPSFIAKLINTIYKRSQSTNS